jgi:hypothetical protein
LSKKFQLKAVYDLSATPYFLNGSGYTPYSLFPWVVSDFGLIEAIESGPHDARLVAFMQSQKIDQLYTMNPRHFNRYANIITILN